MRIDLAALAIPNLLDTMPALRQHSTKRNPMRTHALKHFRLTISTSLVLVAAALVLSSCSKKPQEQIIGKWSVQGQPSLIEFRKDGTVMNGDNPKAAPSKYKFVDDSHMEMQMAVSSGTNKVLVSMTFTVAIHGDAAEFSISAPLNPGEPSKLQTLHLNRVK
jgi:hypothetical protein